MVLLSLRAGSLYTGRILRKKEGNGTNGLKEKKWWIEGQRQKQTEKEDLLNGPRWRVKSETKKPREGTSWDPDCVHFLCSLNPVNGRHAVIWSILMNGWLRGTSISCCLSVDTELSVTCRRLKQWPMLPVKKHLLTLSLSVSLFVPPPQQGLRALCCVTHYTVANVPLVWINMAVSEYRRASVYRSYSKRRPTHFLMSTLPPSPALTTQREEQEGEQELVLISIS